MVAGRTQSKMHNCRPCRTFWYGTGGEEEEECVKSERGWMFRGRRPLTDFFDRLSRRKEFRDARKRFHCVSWLKQGSSEVGEVTDEDSGVEASGEQVLASIFKQGILETDEAYSLVYEA